MSSSSTEAFWAEHLVPAAEALRARGVSFFTPADAESTWAPVDEVPDLSAVERDTLEAALRARWGEHPELAALIDPLIALAEAARAEQAVAEASDASDVSPYMYVMF